MDVSLSSWFVIILAIVAANLPFVNERVFGVVRMPTLLKPFWMRLVEIAFLYAMVVGLAHMFEASAGNVFPQRWEFYAITVCLFIVFAFPGFVFRYLRKRHA